MVTIKMQSGFKSWPCKPAENCQPRKRSWESWSTAHLLGSTQRSLENNRSTGLPDDVGCVFVWMYLDWLPNWELFWSRLLLCPAIASLSSHAAMPCHNPPDHRCMFSSGIYMMLVGAISLIDSDAGDLTEDITLTLLTVGVMVYSWELRDCRKAWNLNGRHGTCGPYQTDRTRKFIDNIIEHNTNRFFKMWFWWVNLVSHP